MENTMPRGKERRLRPFAGSQPVIDQRLIQTEPGRRAQRESQVHTPRISKKRQNRDERLGWKEILSDSLCVPCGEGDPFVGLGGGEHGGSVLFKSDGIEKLQGLSPTDAQSRLLRQIDLKPQADRPILQNAGMVPVHGLADAGAEIENPAFFRPPEIACQSAILPDVDAIDETQLRAEIRREIVVVGGKGEMAAAVRRVRPLRISPFGARGGRRPSATQAMLTSLEIPALPQ